MSQMCDQWTLEMSRKAVKTSCQLVPRGAHHSRVGSTSLLEWDWTDRRTDMRLNDGSASAQVTATLSLNTHTYTHRHTVSHTFVSSFVKKWGFSRKRIFPQRWMVLARQTVRFMWKTESCGLSIFRENAMFSGCALLQDVLRCESKKIEYDTTWELGWTSRELQVS